MAMSWAPPVPPADPAPPPALLAPLPGLPNSAAAGSVHSSGTPSPGAPPPCLAHPSTCSQLQVCLSRAWRTSQLAQSWPGARFLMACSGTFLDRPLATQPSLGKPRGRKWRRPGREKGVDSAGGSRCVGSSWLLSWQPTLPPRAAPARTRSLLPLPLFLSSLPLSFSLFPFSPSLPVLSVSLFSSLCLPQGGERY